MDTNNYGSDMIEIDLMEIMGLLWHRMWLIVICALCAGVAGLLLSRFVITDQYQSTTKIYVLNRQNDNTLTYSDVQLGTQLTKDFPELIKSRYVAEQVIAAWELPYSYEAFVGKINVVTQSDTRIIAITVTDEDPQMAQHLANEVRKVASERIKSVMDIQAVNVVDEANLPERPSSPSVGKWTVFGALAGAFLCIAVILIHFMLDDTIKTADDIEKYLGLSTLGMIPEREDPEKLRRTTGHTGHSRERAGHASARKERGSDSNVIAKESVQEKTAMQQSAVKKMANGSGGGLRIKEIEDEMEVEEEMEEEEIAAEEEIVIEDMELAEVNADTGIPQAEISRINAVQANRRSGRAQG